MRRVIHRMGLLSERDVVRARQRARHLAKVLGFNQQAQIRLGTATSEIARNAFRYAKSGAVEFQIDLNHPQQLVISVTDKGPGLTNLEQIYDGQNQPRTAMGRGIVGTRRLMDLFDIRTGPSGTTVSMGADIPTRAPIEEHDLARVRGEFDAHEPDDPFEEVERQNQELLKTLAELHERQLELAQANRELEDKNRGVLALYAELDERANMLRHVSDLKSGFLSNMSHEFKTPLNSILSLVRILQHKTDGDLTVEQAKQVSYIQRSAQDLSELVNDLLDLAKVEAGKIEIRPKRFVVAELFGALRGVLKPLLQGNSINLVFEDPSQLPAMRTDEGKVSQILRNLIANALKFTQAGEVRISAVPSGHGSIVFSVSDTGIGIAPADHERIFEEFVQIENAMQSARKGTGLGLPLSRKLARLLGGDVTVTSELGQGSIFITTIPVVYPGVVEEEAQAEIPKLQPRQLPTLLIEDNPETAFLLEGYLKYSNFGVVRAHSLDESRAVLRQMRPAVIILDLMIEGEPSWNFLAELQRYSPPIPVLMVSVTSEAKKALALGASAFLQKPLAPDILLPKLREIAVQAPRFKILIIDDDEASRYLLRSVLPEFQSCWLFLEANDGRRGLAIARQELPDIIFLDVRMADVDGFEVLQELRANTDTQHIPVVIHSSYTIGDADRERLNYPRVSVFPKEMLQKPDAAHQLCEILCSLWSAEADPKLHG